MYPMMMSSVPPTPMVPARVSAAMMFMQMMQTKEMGVPSFDGSRSASGSLSKQEQAAYDAAVQLLNQYFSGEMDFGDVPPQLPHQQGGEDDGIKSPVPVK